MLNQVKYFKELAGISVTEGFFNEIFGSQGCDLSEYPLIYEKDNSSPSFDDFKSFGSWTAPYGKIF